MSANTLIIITFAITLLFTLLVPLEIRWIVRYSVNRSGLAALARRFHTAREPAGEKRRMQMIRVGRTWFKNVTVVAAPEGLYLSLGIMNRFAGIEPVLIPWEEVRDVHTVKLYFRRAARLSIGDPEVGSITVFDQLFEPLGPYIQMGGGTIPS